MHKILSVLILGCVVPVSFAFSQKSRKREEHWRTTDINFLTTYYKQDGNHSAVTGGTGTEDLTVFINSLDVIHHADSLNTFFFNIGMDVITSASTDKIDFIVSSASRRDTRFYAQSGYQHLLKGTQNMYGIKPSFSLESDYLSWGLNFWWSGGNQNQTSNYTVNFQGYIDDLRWGRLSKKFRRPVSLVYPEELRDKKWFDIYMRYSYNLSLEWQHDINKRMRLGLFPGVAIQHGLLSTPFHRVYYKDSLRAVVENLPRNRVKLPFGIQWNTFIGSRTIAKMYYRFYWDDFGITGHTFSLELPIEIFPQLSLTPFSRLYTQQSSRYFKPYKVHLPTEEFYTSDYDLSNFSSFKFGFGITYSPLPKYDLRKWSVRYAHYSRSDGLHFNQISSLFQFEKARKK